MNIIGITGNIGSGKSTISEHLVKKYGYTEYAFASPLKEIAKVFGFPEESLYGTQEDKLKIHPYWGISSREFLQKMGTELFRKNMPVVFPFIKSVWVDLFRMKIKMNPDVKYIVSDIRFEDEYNIIKELGGTVIKTIRNNNVLSQDKKETLHESENLSAIGYDFLIDNNKYTKEMAKKHIDILMNGVMIWWAPPCAGGIGDRLLGILTTMMISNVVDVEFLIKWDTCSIQDGMVLEDEYNFYKFENIKVDTVLDMDSFSLQKYFSELNTSSLKNKNVITWSNQNLCKFVKNFSEKDYENALRKVFTFFHPVEYIQDLLEISPEYDIGIHIRTHDNQIYDREKEKIHTDYIRKRLENVKKSMNIGDANANVNANPNIFLASDNLLTFEIAREYFPFHRIEGVIVHTGSEKEKDKEGVEKVVLDLFTLAKKCKTLYVGWHTNFSRIASMYNLERKIFCIEYEETQEVDRKELCEYFSESGRFRM